MALTELEIKAAKAKLKAYSLSDGRGLILDVRPSGGKYWVARLWVDGKEKRKGLGRWPEITLKKARELNYEIRKEPLLTETFFGAIVDEWLEKMMIPRVSASYLRMLKMRINKHVMPAIGKMRIDEITPGVVLAVCRAIEDDGHCETAKRVLGIISQVFDYAVTTDVTVTNPAASISKALSPHKANHYSTVCGREHIGLLMRQIDAYPHVVVRCAMLFSALSFCRPGEVRQAEWSEMDFINLRWSIPAEKMKMRLGHFVPLSRQAVLVLEHMRNVSGGERYVFPSARGNARCMSDGAVRIALRAMGYEKEDMTAHGFRAMASTVLNEYEWPADIIEAQLAHGDSNKIRAAYNRAAYAKTRVAMMQWWADYLDAARVGASAPEKPTVVVTI